MKLKFSRYPEWGSKDKEERSAGASRYAEYVENTYPNDIQYSIDSSYIFDSKHEFPKFDRVADHVDMTLWGCGTTEAIFEATSKEDEYGKVCALNFASFKHPGGMFLLGSTAQEEALCSTSILYPVLKSFEDSYYEWNRHHVNRGLYSDKAIYSEKVLFEATPAIGNEPVITYCDVLTCAAPNFGNAIKYNAFDQDANIKALKRRIVFMYKILAEMGVDTFIAGAWGCGVFKQEPNIVAEIFVKGALAFGLVKRVIFAIPTGYKSVGNYNAFVQVLNENCR